VVPDWVPAASLGDKGLICGRSIGLWKLETTEISSLEYHGIPGGIPWPQHGHEPFLAKRCQEGTWWLRGLDGMWYLIFRQSHMWNRIPYVAGWTGHAYIFVIFIGSGYDDIAWNLETWFFSPPNPACYNCVSQPWLFTTYQPRRTSDLTPTNLCPDHASSSKMMAYYAYCQNLQIWSRT